MQRLLTGWLTALALCLLPGLLHTACSLQPSAVPPDTLSTAARGTPTAQATSQETGARQTDHTGEMPSPGPDLSPVPSQEPSALPSPADTPQPDPTATPVPSPTPSPAPVPTEKPVPTSTPVPSPAISPSGQQIGDSHALNDDFYWIRLDDAIKRRITGISYPADDSNIAIHYDDLRYIRLLHYDFAGEIHEGELIVHATLADEVMEIFHQLYLAHYPLTSVRLVDDFGEPADDTLSMEANNTSAFCYRYVTGTRTLSRHSYGAAIDINPMLNPYIDGDRIVPENGVPYADRTRDFPGKIDHNDICYQLFIARGWSWGGDWAGDKDYQHFSKKINP